MQIRIRSDARSLQIITFSIFEHNVTHFTEHTPCHISFDHVRPSINCFFLFFSSHKYVLLLCCGVVLWCCGVLAFCIVSCPGLSKHMPAKIGSRFIPNLPSPPPTVKPFTIVCHNNFSNWYSGSVVWYPIYVLSTYQSPQLPTTAGVTLLLMDRGASASTAAISCSVSCMRLRSMKCAVLVTSYRTNTVSDMHLYFI